MGCKKCCGSCSLPDFFKLRGSVIIRIWPEIIFCTLLTTMIIIVDKLVYRDFFKAVHLPDNILSLLGVTTGLLLVFRTNTSYDRYYEGRKIWSDMTSSIRTLMRMFWLMEDKNSAQRLVEKVSAVNLLVAFAYAMKHYLREEYSYEEGDFQEFAGHLPHLLTPTSQTPLVEQEILRAKMDANSKKSQSQKSVVEMQGGKATTLKKSLARMKKHCSGADSESAHVGTNVPLEISFYLSSYVGSCKLRGMIDHPTTRVVDKAIGKLVACITSFERVRGTPIPMAYRVHLTHVTWIVLLMLPFHWTEIGWVAVPTMAMASFAMLGILAIGNEIEDPFGYDYNDLDLDDFCQLIHKEAIAITSVPIPSHEVWMFSEDNHPIINNPNLNAPDLLDLQPEQIQRLLFLGKGFQLTEKRTTKPSSDLPPPSDNAKEQKRPSPSVVINVPHS